MKIRFLMMNISQIWRFLNKMYMWKEIIDDFIAYSTWHTSPKYVMKWSENYKKAYKLFYASDDIPQDLE